MPNSCVAIDCNNRANSEKKIKLYEFPTDPVRRNLWISAVKRKSWQPTQDSRICGAHFISGIQVLFIHLAKS